MNPKTAPELGNFELAELLAQEGLEPALRLTGAPRPTLWRWIHTGVYGVRLEAIRRGRCWMTSRAALARFDARLTGMTAVTPIESASSMAKRAARAADAEMKAREEFKKKLRQSRKG